MGGNIGFGGEGAGADGARKGNRRGSVVDLSGGGYERIERVDVGGERGDGVGSGAGRGRSRTRVGRAAVREGRGGGRRSRTQDVALAFELGGGRRREGIVDLLHQPLHPLLHIFHFLQVQFAKE